MIDWEKFSINRAVEQTYFSLLTLLGVLNLLAGAFAIFIVATKSPRHTRAYNILLLNILCWSISADFFQTFFAGFENHWPLPCLEPHGIVSFFDIDETVLDVIATLIVTIYCNMIIAAVSPLSFRCFQLSFPNLTSKMATIHWIIYFFCWHGGTTLAAVYLYASCIAPAQYYRNQLAAYPNLHQILHSKLTCVKMNSAETSTMVYSGLAGFSLDAIALLLFFGLSTYLLRKQHKEAKISEKTYKMQKIVTKNLAVVTFVPLLFFTTPFIVYLLAFSTFQLYANYIMGCTELLMCCHDLVVSVVTLTIYSTYRRATLGYMYKVLRFLNLPESLLQKVHVNHTTVTHVRTK
ncbi:hypothetical protein QR680_007149 [Steinernema hermaphroditum]|uniref:Uncharacterized protein n=1 Tax=Steinernema hermaphroditum TaxID=289476 RepID=A0AA39LXQ7_9BILA|nr:hypothetical protein QR680_007149 [Steinernema hermaphroditum]